LRLSPGLFGRKERRIPFLGDERFFNSSLKAKKNQKTT
jgi:hypothetical protein